MLVIDGGEQPVFVLGGSDASGGDDGEGGGSGEVRDADGDAEGGGGPGCEGGVGGWGVLGSVERVRG